MSFFVIDGTSFRATERDRIKEVAQMADPNKNKTIVRNHFEALNRHDIDAVSAFVAPNHAGATS